MAEKRDCFFFLYVVYFAIQAYLALLAIFWYPPRSSMTPVASPIDLDYQVCTPTPSLAARASCMHCSTCSVPFVLMLVCLPVCFW